MADDADATLDCALQMGDLVLKLRDGTQIKAMKSLLMLASPILRDVLSCSSEQGEAAAPSTKRKRGPEEDGGPAAGQQQERADHAAAGEQERTDHAASSSSCGLPALSVEGSHDAWLGLLRFLYSPALTGKNLELSPASAFKILPIAHAYNMRGILQSCVEVAQRSALPLGPLGPHPPPPPPTEQQASSQQQPDLFQWLALADARQCTSLVHACLGQLSAQQALPVVRSALSYRHSRSTLDHLCSGSLMGLLNVAAGLPSDFQGIQVPDLTREPPSYHVEVADGLDYQSGGCLLGSLLLLLLPAHSCKPQVLDLQTGSAFFLEGESEAVCALDAHSGGDGDGQLAVSAHGGGTVCVWELSSRQCRRTLQDPVDAAVWAVCFCGDRQGRVASGNDRGVVRLWDVETGAAVVPHLGTHESAVYALAATADGQILLSALHDEAVGVYDVREGRCVRRMAGCGPHEEICVAVDGSGRTAASGGCDGRVHTYDVGSGRCMTTFDEHEGSSVYRTCMDVSGTTLVSMGRRREAAVRVFDLARGQQAAAHRWEGFGLRDVCTSKDLSRVAVAMWRASDAEEERGSGTLRVDVWGSL